MDIEETTAKDRLLIGNMVDPLLCSVERSQRLLGRAIERYLGRRPMRDIPDYEALALFDELEAIHDALVTATLEYALVVGGEHPMARSTIRSAERAQKIRQLEDLRMRVPNEVRKLTDGLPDAEAIRILTALTNPAKALAAAETTKEPAKPAEPASTVAPKENKKGEDCV